MKSVLRGRPTAVIAVCCAGMLGCGAPSHRLAPERTGPAPRAWRIKPDNSGDQPTIQAGINASGPGDTVLVAPGIYYENLVIHAKDLALVSIAGSNETTIDGSLGHGPVIKVDGTSRNQNVIDGFTITGGQVLTEPSGGAGILVTGGSIVIRRSHLFRNIASVPHSRSTSGGGMRIVGASGDTDLSHAVIENNVFEENESTSNGGAINIRENVEVRIQGNTFIRNRCGRDGAAIFAFGLLTQQINVNENQFIENIAGDHAGAIIVWATSSLIERNLFWHNEAHGGDGPGDDNNGLAGAVHVVGGSSVVTSNTFAHNTSTDGPYNTGALAVSGTVTITGNIFAMNTPGAIFGNRTTVVGQLSQNVTWMNGPTDITLADGAQLHGDTLNVVGDPLFCDPANGDFSVRPGSAAVMAQFVAGAFSVSDCNRSQTHLLTWDSLQHRLRSR